MRGAVMQRLASTPQMRGAAARARAEAEEDRVAARARARLQAKLKQKYAPGSLYQYLKAPLRQRQKERAEQEGRAKRPATAALRRAQAEKRPPPELVIARNKKREARAPETAGQQALLDRLVSSIHGGPKQYGGKPHPDGGRYDTGTPPCNRATAHSCSTPATLTHPMLSWRPVGPCVRVAPTGFGTMPSTWDARPWSIMHAEKAEPGLPYDPYLDETRIIDARDFDKHTRRGAPAFQFSATERFAVNKVAEAAFATPGPGAYDPKEPLSTSSSLLSVTAGSTRNVDIMREMVESTGRTRAASPSEKRTERRVPLPRKPSLTSTATQQKPPPRKKTPPRRDSPTQRAAAALELRRQRETEAGTRSPWRNLARDIDSASRPGSDIEAIDDAARRVSFASRGTGRALASTPSIDARVRRPRLGVHKLKRAGSVQGKKSKRRGGTLVAEAGEFGPDNGTEGPRVTVTGCDGIAGGGATQEGSLIGPGLPDGSVASGDDDSAVGLQRARSAGVLRETATFSSSYPRLPQHHTETVGIRPNGTLLYSEGHDKRVWRSGSPLPRGPRNVEDVFVPQPFRSPGAAVGYHTGPDLGESIAARSGKRGPKMPKHIGKRFPMTHVHWNGVGPATYADGPLNSPVVKGIRVRDPKRASSAFKSTSQRGVPWKEKQTPQYAGGDWWHRVDDNLKPDTFGNTKYTATRARRSKGL